MPISLIKRTTLGLATLSVTGTASAFFPFITDDTGTQGRGGNQVEITYEFVKEYSEVIDESGRLINSTTGISNAFPMTYTYGVTDDIDIFLGVSRQTNPINGWQNTEIGAKWTFAGDQTTGWSAAIKPVIILPVSTGMQNAGLGNAQTNWGATLIGSYLKPDYEFHLNAGYTSNRYSVTSDAEPLRTNLWSVSAAPILVLNDQWKLGFDIGWQTNPGYNSNYSVFGGIGVQYSPIKNLQIGIGAFMQPAINATDNAWSYTVTTGIAYQF